MTNEITKIFSSLSNDELRQAILEMKEDEPLGIIRTDGWVRKITKQVCDITGETNLATHLFLTQNNLFREASFRFIS